MRDTFALGGGPYHFFCQKLAKRGGIQHLLRQQLSQPGDLDVPDQELPRLLRIC